MNALFKNIFSDKTLFWGFLSSFILILANFSYTLFSYINLPPYIPLYNQMPWGEKRLGEKPEIFLPVLIATFIFIFNMILVIFLYKKIPILARILCITGFLSCFFALLVVIRTLQLVI
ncbi:MAG: hypothetical protein Q7K55_04285 [Candidatus Levybacteria bacterium]|nr:hypothetical protein [Candidatus Levybacteria bacterium]